MKYHARMAVILFLVSANVCAQDLDSVKEGASDYDWNICYDNKMDACKLACSSSDDVGCQEDCETTSSDKCKSEGLQPPEYN